MQSDVTFFYQTDFSLKDEELYIKWLTACAQKFGAVSIALSFAFMDDVSLHKLNLKHLNHDTYTDIITFDDSLGKEIIANIAISIDRVLANAQAFSQPFDAELCRVMSHGLLHCLGFNDKTEQEQVAMTQAEEDCLNLFHVEHKTTIHVS